MLRQAMPKTHSPFATFVHNLRFVNQENQWCFPPSEDRFRTLETDLREYYPELNQSIKIMATHIKKIKTFCANQNIGLVSFALPHRQLLWDWDECTQYTPKGLYEKGKGLRKVERILDRHGMPRIPIYDIWSKREDIAELYYHVDAHLTPKGNEQVVALLYEYLVTEYFQRIGGVFGHRMEGP